MFLTDRCPPAKHLRRYLRTATSKPREGLDKQDAERSEPRHRPKKEVFPSLPEELISPGNPADLSLLY